MKKLITFILVVSLVMAMPAFATSDASNVRTYDEDVIYSTWKKDLSGSHAWMHKTPIFALCANVMEYNITGNMRSSERFRMSPQLSARVWVIQQEILRSVEVHGKEKSTLPIERACWRLSEDELL